MHFLIKIISSSTRGQGSHIFFLEMAIKNRAYLLSILGLDESIYLHHTNKDGTVKSAESILKTRYKKLALKFHPDKNSSEKAGEAFRRINDAYDQLLKMPRPRTFSSSNFSTFTSRRSCKTKNEYEKYEEIFKTKCRFRMTRQEDFIDNQCYDAIENLYKFLKHFLNPKN